jgi:prevent-host-death family protein
MREIGELEAKNEFGQLLDMVERGQEITITRQGRQVARLVPVERGFSREEAHAAAHQIREQAERLKLGPFNWDEWKVYRDEGRR